MAAGTGYPGQLEPTLTLLLLLRIQITDTAWYRVSEILVSLSPLPKARKLGTV